MHGRLGHPTVVIVNNVLTRTKELSMAIANPDDVE